MFLIIFLDLLGVGIIAPIAPFVVARFEADGAFFGTALAVTLLTLSYSAAQFLATPVLGALSDRVGRRPVLLGSMIGTAAGYVLFALGATVGGGSYWVVLGARVLDGATGGNISAAQAALADITPPAERAKAFGLVGAAFGLGFTLGPAISAMLSGFGPLAPVWASAGLAMVTSVLIAVYLPETLAREHRRAGRMTAADFNPLGTLARAMMIAGLPVLLGVVFLVNFAHAEMRTTFALFLKEHLGMDQRHAGWMFAYVGLMAVLVQGVLVRKVEPALGARRTAVIGLPIAACGYGLIPLADSSWVMLGAITLMALGGGLAGPSISSMLSSSAGPEKQGTVLGASASVAALSLVVGPVAAGLLYDHAGDAWPYWTGACAVVLGWLVLTLRVRGAARA